MARRLEEMFEEVPERERLATILEVVGDCLRRHRQLHAAVMTAQATLLEQQAAQAFRPPASLRLLDVTDEALLPLLDASSAEASAALDQAFSGFGTAHAPRVLGLGALLTRMLARERELAQALGAAAFEGDLDEDEPAGCFDDEVSAAAQALLDRIEGPVLLSGLLAGIEDKQSARWIGLAAAAAFDPDPVAGGLVARASGGRLSPGPVEGDDLVLGRLVEGTDEHR